MNIILILLFLFPSISWATTVTFQEGVSGYAGTQDATIYSFSTNEHVTNVTQTKDTDRRYIVCWDISGASIPSSATINSATTQFYMDEQNCTSETVDAHKINDPDGTDPFPSNASSADVFNSYSTWRYKNETGTVKWSSGGGSSNFTDVADATVVGSVASGACPGSVAKSITVTSLVASQVAASKANVCMWLGINDSSGNVKIASKRDATSSHRPLLTIDYTAASSQSATNGFFF